MPVEVLLGTVLLGGGGGGALLCVVTAPSAAPPGPGIGGTLLARWAEVTGVVGDVGDVSNSMLDLSEALMVAVACGCRGLLGSDGTGPVCGNAGGLSGLEDSAPSFSEVFCRRLRFTAGVTAGVSFSESEPALCGVGLLGGGRGSGRAMLVSTQTDLILSNK